ncbi:MAG: HD-GYP domain-containing protein [Desulfovibrionaceae bacterium]|nr:HD-GYP domain-containing protein [Desulfovibrionaceae bacterium]
MNRTVPPPPHFPDPGRIRSPGTPEASEGPGASGAPGGGILLRRISVQDLRPGMYVVDSGLSWTEHPFLYSEEGLVRSAEHARAVAAEGYIEVFVDPARSANAACRPARGAAADAELGRSVATARGPAPDRGAGHRAEHRSGRRPVPLARETGPAGAIYRDSIQCARSFLHDAEAGNPIDVAAAERCVRGVMGSVGRNADALVSLSRLRTFDAYTFTHCVNVAVLSVVFGSYLGLAGHALRRLGMAALFHDLGKARIPAEVLNKPGRLTEREFAIVQRHPREGLEVLRRNGVEDEGVLLGVVQHHEKHNGRGYPGRLPGGMVHEFGSIIALADVYDALTSERVYKRGMLANRALQIMYGMREADFAPGWAERFIKCLGIYPVGSLVRLEDGRLAVVLEANPEAPLRPTVRLLRADGGSGEVLDLGASGFDSSGPDLLGSDASGPDAPGPAIADCLDPTAHGVDVARHLF